MLQSCFFIYLVKKYIYSLEICFLPKKHIYMLKNQIAHSHFIDGLVDFFNRYPVIEK